MAAEFDDDDDAEFGGFEMADAPTVAEAQPLPPALQIRQIVQPGYATSQPEPEVCPENVEGHSSQTSVLEAPTTLAVIPTTAVCVVADSNDITTNGPTADELCTSPASAPMQSVSPQCTVGTASELPHLNESDTLSTGASCAAQLKQCQTQLHAYEQKYAELQKLRSAEMLEMHQRTREAVDSIVRHYQKLLSETVRQCEDVCKQQIKEAIDSERASLADVMQNQQEVMNRLIEERSCALEVHFEECLAEQRIKQQEVHEELRQEERRQTEEHINTLLQEKDNAIKQAVEEAVQLERDHAKQTTSDEREQLLQLVHEQREHSQKAAEELIAEERIKFQQSMENTVHEYQTRVDTLMSRTLQLAQEQIKTYIGEQRRDDDAMRLRLLSSVDVLLDTARSQLQQLLVTPSDHAHTLSSDSAEH